MSAGKHGAIVTGVLMLTGCALMPDGNNEAQSFASGELAALAHTTQPRVRIADFAGEAVSRFQTFAVAPVECSKRAGAMPAYTNGALFALRSQFEARGYAFAGNEKPAILVLMDYRGSAADSSTGAQFDTAFTAPPAVLSPATIGRCQRTDWGTAPPAGPPLRPNDAAYRVLVQLTAYDLSNGAAIWNGQAIGSSLQGDPAVSSQLLLRALLREFPMSSDRWRNLTLGFGNLGFGFIVASADGSRFRPVISTIREDGPADTAGLLVGDQIIKINGIDTLNMSTAEFSAMIAGAPGTVASFTVARSGLMSEHVLQRAQVPAGLAF